MTTKKAVVESPKEKVGPAAVIGMIGGILAIVVVLVGAVTYVLVLKTRVDILQPEATLKITTDAGVGAVQKAESDALKDFQRQTTGLITPVSEVVCTHGVDGCAHPASPDPNNPSTETFDVEVPPNRKLVAAWYSLSDNVSDIRAFHRIDVSVTGEKSITCPSPKLYPSIENL